MFILPNTANNNFFLGKCWLHRFDIQFLDKWPLLLCFSQVDSLPNFSVRTQMITNWIQTLIYESRLSYRSETGLLEIAIRSVWFWKWRYLMTVVFRSVTFFSAVMPAHLYVDMITMINCFSSICFTPCLRSGSHRWNQELFVTARGMDSQRSHRSFVFLWLKNEVDFWVEVNFWKNEHFFVAYNKIQTLTLLEKLLIDADWAEKF